MKDLISRQDAVSRIADLLMLELQGKRIPTWDEVHNAMQDLPSANQWIPCSERLPEEEGFYLVSVGAAYNPIRVYEYKPRKMHGQENLWKGSDISYCFNWFVEAWMPLPQPWKEVEDES